MKPHFHRTARSILLGASSRACIKACGLVAHFMKYGEPVGGFQRFGAETRRRWLEAMEPIEPIHDVGHASRSA